MLKVKVRKRLTPEEYRRRPWFTEKVARRISIYFTWLFLQLGLSANQVSFFVFILGVFSGIAFIWGNFLLAALILQCWYLTDAVDGEIARYHGVDDLTGAYTDKLMHYLIEGWIFYSIGMGLAGKLEIYWICYVGLWVTFFFTFLKLIYDLKYNCFVTQAQFSKKAENFLIKKVEEKDLPDNCLRERVLKTYSLYPNVMNIITVAVLLDYFWRGFQWMGLTWSLLLMLLFSYMLFYPVACLKGLYLIISERKIDKEYEEILTSDTHNNVKDI
ncbi:MAG: CDP-alcohol phosphatidyltransferase family protein [Thermoplasmatales archaeon]|nr:MAG: CDP-alcohol phosphatidyltransferase family protein [Thermoplasmatales archaeon]